MKGIKFSTFLNNNGDRVVRSHCIRCNFMWGQMVKDFGTMTSTRECVERQAKAHNCAKNIMMIRKRMRTR